MKRSLALVLLSFVLSSHTCNKTDAATMAALMNTQWNLQSLGGSAIQLPSGAKGPWLQLVDAAHMDGFGGCNKLMGSYAVDGDRLSFSNLGGTKMFCENTMELERKFTSALGTVDGYTIDGGTLKLMQGGSEVAVLVKQ